MMMAFKLPFNMPFTMPLDMIGLAFRVAPYVLIGVCLWQLYAAGGRAEHERQQVQLAKEEQKFLRQAVAVNERAAMEAATRAEERDLLANSLQARVDDFAKDVAALESDRAALETLNEQLTVNDPQKPPIPPRRDCAVPDDRRLRLLDIR